LSGTILNLIKSYNMILNDKILKFWISIRQIPVTDQISLAINHVGDHHNLVCTKHHSYIKISLLFNLFLSLVNTSHPILSQVVMSHSIPFCTFLFLSHTFPIPFPSLSHPFSILFHPIPILFPSHPFTIPFPLYDFSIP